jgi:hypothetical protein
VFFVGNFAGPECRVERPEKDFLREFVMLLDKMMDVFSRW